MFHRAVETVKLYLVSVDTGGETLCEYRLDREQSHLQVTLRAGQIKHGAAESLLAACRQRPAWKHRNRTI